MTRQHETGEIIRDPFGVSPSLDAPPIDAFAMDIRHDAGSVMDELARTRELLETITSDPNVDIRNAAVFVADAIARLGVLSRLASEIDRKTQVVVKDVDRSEAERRTSDLTGLPNLKAFEETLESLIRLGLEDHGRQTDGWSDFAVVFCDLDNFKNINELIGHSNADEVIKFTGKKLKDSVRATSDAVFHRSGDEFFLIIRGITGEDDLNARIDRIQNHVSAKVSAQKDDSESLVIVNGVNVDEEIKDHTEEKERADTEDKKIDWVHVGISAG